MQLSSLSALHCPFCGSSLELVFKSPRESGADDGHEVSYGVLQCGCSRYPVVEGIPIVQHIDGVNSIVDLIKNRDMRRALLQAMNIFRIKWAHRTRWHQIRYYLNCRRLVAGQDLSFEDAVNLVRRPKVFSDYLLHRYANPSFLAAVGVLQLLGSLEEDSVEIVSEGLSPKEMSEQSRSQNRPRTVSSNSGIRVIDLACGAGHSSFLMQHLYPRIHVFSTDSDFISLYLAKRFLAPDATHVCFDAEFPSPFPDNYFNGVFCLDAFHYIRSKKALVAELNRILTSEAIWLFPHLHNALQHNVVAGVPLSPERYLECFGFLDARVFDEGEILLGLCERHMLDLRTKSTVSQVDGSRNLTLIGGPQKIWSVHRGFPSSFCRERTRLAINPIYRVEQSGADLELSLTWPNPLMKEECFDTESVMPRKYQINKHELRQLLDSNSHENGERLSELVGKFVLVPLASRYRRESFQ